MSGSTLPNDPLLSLRDVQRSYAMGHTKVAALVDVNLTIRQGESLVITGPSGSGKSTLLHLLGLLDRPDGGRLCYRGRTVQELSDRALSAIRNEEIGFVFQSFNLLPDHDAFQNVMLPLIYRRAPGSRRALQERARQALQAVGLEDRLHHRPLELSGGQQQRVAIARALVKKPSLILADEPTGNLDSAAGAEILKLLDELSSRGLTVVLITHDPQVAAHAQRRIELLDGRLVSDTRS